MGQKSKLAQLYRILEQVHSFKDHMEKLPDEELQGLTEVFMERLHKGETLDDLLPEAFAAICEADKRVLGMFPFDAQILGGIALHKGYLAEMNTGEGKTLVATMPLYLNALTKRGAILVTTNEYLALRDAEEMGQVYKFMGLSVSAGVKESESESFSNKEKKAIYDSDIVYTTHSILGFDYLLNNLVTSKNDRFMRELYYVIIDEADAVLLDSAQTPLVISGSPRVQSNLYELADFFVTTLREGIEYEKEDKKVWLTEEGVRYAERFFRIDNFYDEAYFEINRHVILALRAHALFEMEKEYVISSEGTINLLDGASGRSMPGVKLRGGQHQAIEAKERLKISQETRSVASITFQNLFLLFEKLSGMSGTISDAAEEILNVYHTEVIVIPPNKKVARIDMPDLFFRDAESQFAAALEKAIEIHKTGQPVLVVVTTIAETELVSKMLMNEGISHSVLNANNAFWEAGIIKEAGKKSAVTVATSMAGRGTDIKLGQGVRELGGLAVIGIGRLVNVRQERQSRGRAGRQGDPGLSICYVSLEDDVVKTNAPSKIQKMIEQNRSFPRWKMKSIINKAQKLGEELAVGSRKSATDYDLVLQMQRALIYQTRNSLLDGEKVEREQILHIADRVIGDFLDRSPEISRKELSRFILDHISYRVDEDFLSLPLEDQGEVRRYLLTKVEQSIDKHEEVIGNEHHMDEFVRICILTALDEAWVEQVDYLQQLRVAVSGRATAQRNVMFEYQNESLESFRKMEKVSLVNAMRNILLSDVYFSDDKDGRRLNIILP